MLTIDACPDADLTLKVLSDAAGRMRVRISGFEMDAVRAVAIEGYGRQGGWGAGGAGLSPVGVGGDLVIARGL